MAETLTCARRSAPDRSRRGLVLVASVGILGVLSVMALAFASVMRLEARAARNFGNAVRAEFAARAGIEDAIARLRSIARDGMERPYEDGEPAAWYTWDGTAGGGRRLEGVRVGARCAGGRRQGEEGRGKRVAGAALGKRPGQGSEEGATESLVHAA